MTPRAFDRGRWCLALALAGCGPKVGADDEAGETTQSSTSNPSTAPTTSTTDPPTTTGSTSLDTGDPTTSDAPGACPPGWELPASISATVHVFGVEVATDFDPAIVYPDGTPAACVRWDAADLAGVRLAFGPAVGAGPESLIEAVVSAGERDYTIDPGPPAPGAYDGISAAYTAAVDGKVEHWDFVTNAGIGFLQATWVPKAPGEHIVFNAKLSMGPMGADPLVGFEVDAVVGEAVPLDCAAIDTPNKCLAAGCAEWLHTRRITDVKTCEFVDDGECVAELAQDPDDYDSAYWKLVDGVVELRRVGGEACDFSGPQHPADWAECDHSPDDPPDCDCVCAGGACPGDTALALLEACNLPQPCPDLDAAATDWSDGEDCLYAAMAAAEPAVLRVHTNFGDADFDDRVVVRGDGTATWLRGACDVSCGGSCSDRDYGLPRTCSARPPAFFTDCAAAIDPDVLAGCRDVAAWLVDCAILPASCP